MLAIVTISIVFSLFGLLLGYSVHRFKVKRNPIADRIDALLPQSQCGQCGYPGCRPYALAIAAGEADINQCPPGGEECIVALSDLLAVEPLPLNQDYGQEPEKHVAVVVEQDCIGCALCIPACPVDAIVGAARQMHTVIRTECTGCDLCLPACPVDCIVMIPSEVPVASRATHNRPAVSGIITAMVEQHLPCIRCGDCEPACPVNLLPQQLYWHCRSSALEKAEDFALQSCIECGRCEAVCPSAIPLVQYYRSAKSEIIAKQRDKAEADYARTRYLAHQARLEQEKIDQITRMRQRKLALKKIRAQQITQSVARVKARKQAESGVDSRDYFRIPPR